MTTMNTTSMMISRRIPRISLGTIWLLGWLCLAAWFGFGREWVKHNPAPAQAAVSSSASRGASAPGPDRWLTPPEANAPRLTDTPTLEAVPLGQMKVGDQIPADNPTGEKDTEFGNTVDPTSWRKLVLLAPKKDGSFADVELLRPLWWLEEQAAEVGGTVDIHVPECGIEGRAEVLAIETCPPIKHDSRFRIVTGTFKHQASKVLDVYVEGLDEPIGTSPNHPFWSEDRQTFVRADELKEGEHLRAFNGTPIVRRIVPLADPEPVFNLEVQCDHVYHVARSGVLVHNSEPCPILMSVRSLLGRQGPREMTQGTINSMANAMRQNADAFWQQAGPIRVAVRDGKRIIIDGHHRAAAARQAGITDVPVISEQVSDSRWGKLFLEVMEVLDGH